MVYFARCNGVFNKNSVELVDEKGQLFFTLKHAKLPIISGLNIKDEVNSSTFKVNYNPLRFKKRFQLLDSVGSEVLGISVGLKYLHKILYKDKIYACKGSIWKVRYNLYDQDNVVASIQVVKIDKEKFFKIELADNTDIMLALAMLIIAQSIRERIFII